MLSNHPQASTICSAQRSARIIFITLIAPPTLSTLPPQHPPTLCCNTLCDALCLTSILCCSLTFTTLILISICATFICCVDYGTTFTLRNRGSISLPSSTLCLENEIYYYMSLALSLLFIIRASTKIKYQEKLETAHFSKTEQNLKNKIFKISDKALHLKL